MRGGGEESVSRKKKKRETRQEQALAIRSQTSANQLKGTRTKKEEEEGRGRQTGQQNGLFIPSWNHGVFIKIISQGATSSSFYLPSFSAAMSAAEGRAFFTTGPEV